MSSRACWFAALALSLCIAGCDVPATTEDGAQATGTATPGGAAAAGNNATPVAQGQAAPIHIASFNIQVFGTAKMKKPQVVQVLVDVVRRFDVVAIQEVRCKEDTLIPEFVAQVNATGRHYDFVIGPRLGRTSSKEQYTFVFDRDRIEVDRGAVYTVADPQDKFQREPTVARFRVRGVPPEQAFTFALADIHTEPDEAKNEMDALADAYVGIQRNGWNEDDIILLGDLNSDEYHLGRMGQLPGIAHVVTGTTTNTRHTHMYDNILFDGRTTREYTGRWGVFDLEGAYHLTQQQALEVSDHFPVWGEFSPYEAAGSNLAGRPAQAR